METMEEVRMRREKPGEIYLTGIGINGFIKKQGFFFKMHFCFFFPEKKKKKHGPAKCVLASCS